MWYRELLYAECSWFLNEMLGDKMTGICLKVLVIALLACACSGQVVSSSLNDAEPFARPYAQDSIWNRTVPIDAQFADVQDSIWGDPDQVPTHLGVDLVSIHYTDPTQPVVNFRLTRGWNFPQRSWPRGETIFRRNLSPEAGTELQLPSTGNALYVIINPLNGLADEGVGAWRNAQPAVAVTARKSGITRDKLASLSTDFLTLYDDELLHGIDVVNGDGLRGPRGTGLSTLGGTVRLGEINTHIPHALAVMGSSRRYSRANPFMWPASRADSFAGNPIWGYLGTDVNYAMGTLLAIPPSVDVEAIEWNTPQGLVLAKNAQEFGWYIVDSGTGGWGGHSFKFAMERNAAALDFGLTIDPQTDDMEVDSALVDAVGLNLDVQQILTLVQAVTNNTP